MHKKRLKSIYGKTKEIDQTVDEASKDIEIVKRRLVPFRNLTVSKEVTLCYVEALKEIGRTNQKISNERNRSASFPLAAAAVCS